jgi:DNA polymerase-3 subunit epsilon
MHDFTAIDIKLMPRYRKCSFQIGLVRIENFELKDELNLLIQKTGAYNIKRKIIVNSRIEFLQYKTSIPELDNIWQKINPFIKGQLVVAYNGLDFEFPVIERALLYYDISNFIPRYYNSFDRIENKDTKRYSLQALCKQYKIPLNHLDALSVAKACAALYIIYLRENRKQ